MGTLKYLAQTQMCVPGSTSVLSEDGCCTDSISAFTNLQKAQPVGVLEPPLAKVGPILTSAFNFIKIICELLQVPRRIFAPFHTCFSSFYKKCKFLKNRWLWLKEKRKPWVEPVSRILVVCVSLKPSFGNPCSLQAFYREGSKK